MDGPDRLGKEEIEEFVKSYKDSLSELVSTLNCVNRSSKNRMTNILFDEGIVKFIQNYFINFRLIMKSTKNLMTLPLLYNQD